MLRLALNLKFSCFSISSTEIASVRHCAQMKHVFNSADIYCSLENWLDKDWEVIFDRDGGTLTDPAERNENHGFLP